VFVFLGEFGYEIFNWQGVVRKFANSLPKTSRIVVAGRRGLEAFYESASHYIDISDFEAYRNSVAAAYFAIPPDMQQRGSPYTAEEIEFDGHIKYEIRRHVSRVLTSSLGWNGKIEFVFSSSLTAFPGCVFGVDRMYYGSRVHVGSIYSHFEWLLRNNTFKKIGYDEGLCGEIGRKLGFSLSEPYVLVQKRSRKIGPQFGVNIDESEFVWVLQGKVKVVLLSFNTGRTLDSESSIRSRLENCVNYGVSSFGEQSCLIAHAKKCVFITEGDLGSHTYLPPLLGKDVYVIASRDVLSKPSAPISSWNEWVFRFGGKMIPLEVESVLASREAMVRTVKKILDEP
jgi:hypothetical protein